MVSGTLTLDEAVLRFYRRLAERTGLPLEQVRSDALFRLAGELSLEALSNACHEEEILL